MKDDQDQDFPGYLWIPGRARWKINFGPKVHRTWKNRHLVPIWFPHSSSTSLYDLPFLGAKSHLKEGRPWMTFLSRSNEGRRFFQFAIENFKRRPLTHSRSYISIDTILEREFSMCRKKGDLLLFLISFHVLAGKNFPGGFLMTPP